MARYKSLSRLRTVGNNTVIGGSGDYSDFQFINRLLEERVVHDHCQDDGYAVTARAVHSYLSRVMYQRRNKFDPLWNSVVVCGRQDGASFLGVIDLVGTAYAEDFVATGYGEYLALPLLRNAYRPDLSRAEAKAVLDECMRVLVYRDCRTLNKLQLADINDAGVSVSEPYTLSTDWAFGEKVAHAAEGSW